MGKRRIASTHNGNQDAVYDAVRGGHRDLTAILRVTGLDENAVRNALRRLGDRNLVRRDNGHYRAVERCVLAEVWKGAYEARS
jgi:DNA-binding MarR family transcriptional regulator